MNAASTKAALAAALIAVATLSCAVLTHGPRRAPAPALADIAVPSNVPLFTDDFSDSSTGWQVQNTSEAAIDHNGGALRVKVWSPQFFAWSGLQGQTYDGVHVEVTVKDGSPDREHVFGLICGQQGTQAAEYFFAVNPNGMYEIGKRVPDSPIYKILTGYGSWTQTVLIPKKAASYRLGADCGSGLLALYVNGKRLDTASDFSYPSGMVGVFVRSGNQSAGPVFFDDFQISGLSLRGGR